jgi:hypothetical protein
MAVLPVARHHEIERRHDRDDSAVHRPVAEVGAVRHAGHGAFPVSFPTHEMHLVALERVRHAVAVWSAANRAPDECRVDKRDVAPVALSEPEVAPSRHVEARATDTARLVLARLDGAKAASNGIEDVAVEAFVHGHADDFPEERVLLRPVVA